MRDRIMRVSAAVAAVALLVAVIWALVAPRQYDIDDLTDAVGRQVIVDDAEVESVPGDEGFWITGHDDSAWVQLKTAGESPFTVRAGDRVSFTGVVVAHGADFAERPEFSEVDARRLIDAGAHIEVPVGDVKLTG
jgi:hypothetical protein